MNKNRKKQTKGKHTNANSKAKGGKGKPPQDKPIILTPEEEEMKLRYDISP